MHDNREHGQSMKNAQEEPMEELRFRVRADLYRAFRRCVWMTIHETGMTQDEIHNMLIEDLLREKGC